MLFADLRRERGLTLVQTCAELGLSEKSAGWLSDIETGKREASPLLAIRIERWSDGKVAAESVCRKLDHGATSPSDPASVAPATDEGAGKTDRNIPRTDSSPALVGEGERVTVISCGPKFRCELIEYVGADRERRFAESEAALLRGHPVAVEGEDQGAILGVWHFDVEAAGVSPVRTDADAAADQAHLQVGADKAHRDSSVLLQAGVDAESGAGDQSAPGEARGEVSA